MASSTTKNSDAIRTLSSEIRSRLRCPVCRHEIWSSDKDVSCAGCGQSFPVLHGIPVLINEQNSIFSIEDFIQQRNTFFDLAQPRMIKSILRRLTPTISKNVRANANYSEFSRLLLKESESPKVLVLGGSILGRGMEPLVASRGIELVETDVSFGPRTKVICDGHDIPWADESFDGVVVQAVLEHVLDPSRCVEKIHRVLKKDGLVYAEVPFMQQIHGAPYDFMRFSHLGLRWLFRWFEEIDLGICTGPGMALAWSYQYFLCSFTSRFHLLIKLLVSLSAWHLKYFDHFLSKRKSALDAASGCYFLGKKADKPLSGRDMLRYHERIQSRDTTDSSSRRAA